MCPRVSGLFGYACTCSASDTGASGTSAPFSSGTFCACACSYCSRASTRSGGNSRNFSQSRNRWYRYSSQHIGSLHFTIGALFIWHAQCSDLLFCHYSIIIVSKPNAGCTCYAARRKNEVLIRKALWWQLMVGGRGRGHMDDSKKAVASF